MAMEARPENAEAFARESARAGGDLVSTKHDREDGGTKWERMAATLAGVGDRSTGWVAARVKDTFSEFVSRFIYGETTTPEPSDKWEAPTADKETPERERETPDKDRQRQDGDEPGRDR
jgi:hypothetical protein